MMKKATQKDIFRLTPKLRELIMKVNQHVGRRQVFLGFGLGVIIISYILISHFGIDISDLLSYSDLIFEPINRFIDSMIGFIKEKQNRFFDSTGSFVRDMWGAL